MQHGSVTEQAVGAVGSANGTRFRIWAPASARVDVMVERDGGAEARALSPSHDGWFQGEFADIRAGDRYRIRLDGDETYPDPLSRFQPEGVHGPSEVVDLESFAWTDDEWSGRELEDLVIYELHVGTATAEGTFDALIEKLPYLVDLGVTAIELMPVSEFPGRRNWGYDGVYLFAPASAYGGPDGMRRLVDAAHGHGLAVLLDVVYNHFGPEGNYLPAVSGGRIFTERHHTPWGAAVNYDDEGSAGVRRMILDNVRQWIRDYHIDGLRLDAAHAIMDESETHILQEIAEAARAAARHPVVVIAEDERNERTLLLPPGDGGLGLDGVWADDAHHVLRRLAAGDSDGYYAAYSGTTEELARAIRQGWLYQGEHYEPTSEKRGTPSNGIPAPRFVHCIQNHDQVGNRALGERLNHNVEPAVFRAASSLLLLTPCTPLLWMGQEWAASTPFLYFTDHPEELGRLVTKGRRDEFKGFAEFNDNNLDRIPDPQSPDTFRRSQLKWDESERMPHAGVLALYRELLRLRRAHAALAENEARRRSRWDVQALSEGGVGLRRSAPDGRSLLLVANFQGPLDAAIESSGGAGGDEWRVVLDTEEERFGGSGGGARVEGGRVVMEGAGAVLLERGGQAGSGAKVA